MAEREKTEVEKLAEALNDRERLFVHEYLVDLNGTKAATRAGYSEKTAASQASRLLRKAAVKAYRDALLQEKFDAIGVTRHSIALEIWKLYERCTQQRPVEIWDSTKRKYVFAGLWQFDVKGALKALDMLRQLLPEMKEDADGGGESYEDMLGGGGAAREF